ncbi:MAG TPA: VOC family protein [Trueperaceae bacterium]
MTMPASSSDQQANGVTARDQKIVPHLWFDEQAEEAVAFYTSVFPDARRGTETRYSEEGREIHGRPPGSVMTVEFELAGTRFMALNGGPHFRFNPSISFFVHCDSIGEVDRLWAQLSEGGVALMELDSYDWSDRYGWVQDRFGVSWQVMHTVAQQRRRRLVPSLLFTGEEPQAQAAMELYTEVFPDSRIEATFPHPAGGPLEGMIAHAQFTLFGEPFVAMDGGAVHPFTFNEAISLLVECEDQDEIDRYWERLGEGGDPRAQQCGWLKDRFGVSWQIAPRALGRMLVDPDRSKVDRVIRAFMPMKKLDLAQLEAAYRG